MEMQTMTDFYIFLPRMIGALFVANALHFFGQNDKLGKNNLNFASLGFFILVFQNLFNILLPLLIENKITPPATEDFIYLINISIISLASLCMVAGAFEYAHTFSWMSKIVTIPAFFLIWSASIFLAKDGVGAAQNLFQTTYLAVGLVLLGFFFCFTRFSRLAYNLRFSGIFVLLLSAYYFQDLFNWKYRFWMLEACLYFLLVWSIFRTTMGQLRKDLRDMVKELKVAKEKIPMFIQSSPFPVIISALKDDHLLLANAKACELFNIEATKMKLFHTKDYYADANTHSELLQRLLDTPIVEKFQALLKKTNSNETFWLEISARIINYDNEVALYSSFKDITDQKKREYDLFAKAVLDPLTGCYNRRQFQELATREIQTASRYGTQFCLIMMDIDHFKNVNDTHGHAFGDQVLQTLAKICKSTVRETDIFARYGGEEFICMLPQTDFEDGKKIAERLRNNVEQAVVRLPSGDAFKFTISMGITDSASANTLDELIKNADSALYMAKENGRNQVRYFGEIIQEKNISKPDNSAIKDISSDSVVIKNE